MRFATFLALLFLVVTGLLHCGVGADSSIGLFSGSGGAALDDAGAGPDAKSDAPAGDSAACAALHCSGDTPYCDPEGGVCVACLSHAHCIGDHPWCSPGHVCVQCLSDTQCQTSDLPKCLLSEGRCVECLGPAQCSSGICNADHECSN